MTTPLFSVNNHQIKECGKPPTFTDADRTLGDRRSYFENRHGEQWIFTHNRDTRLIRVYSGDCGWDKVLSVRRFSLATLQQVFERWPDNELKEQCRYVLTGGHPPVPVVLATLRDFAKSHTPQEAFTVLFDADGNYISTAKDEASWLDACIAASQAIITVMSPVELQVLITRLMKDEG